MLFLLGGVGALLLVSVFLGGYLMFKGKAGPGEGFVRTPKGQVFSIPDAEEATDFPDEDKKVVAARAEKFLSSILGGGQ